MSDVILRSTMNNKIFVEDSQVLLQYYITIYINIDFRGGGIYSVYFYCNELL